VGQKGSKICWKKGCRQFTSNDDTEWHARETDDKMEMKTKDGWMCQ
jgi:hypothetical protein